MLDYNILNNKPEISIVTDGEQVIMADLLAPTYKQLNLPVDVIYVNKEYVARPDLISLAMYGDDMYADILCKMNGISNPFELNEGMYIYCPAPEDLVHVIIKNPVHSTLVNNNASPLNGENSNGTGNKLKNVLSKRNIKNTIEAIKSKVKLKSDRRTPSDTTIGDKNFIIDKSKGIIIY